MLSTHQAEFTKLFKSLCNRHQPWRVFGDFCEMGALAISNAMQMVEVREQRYLQIVQAYSADELAIFPQLLAKVALGLEGLDCDFLGELFGELELTNHWKGQFFTPMTVSRTIASLLIDDDLKATIERRGFITVQEPACGAGGMVIALASAMLQANVNYQQSMHVSAIDVDPTAAHMAYIQLSLLHVPAAVYVGNTLSMEMRDCFYTPAHYLGLWDWKLRRMQDEQIIETALPISKTPDPINEMPAVIKPVPTISDLRLPTPEQPDLFDMAG